MAPRPKSGPDRHPLPSREDVLAYVAEHPGRTGKREIARAFGVPASDRPRLRRLIAELVEQGALEKSGGRLTRPGRVPTVSVLQTTGRDDNGDLIARPVNWDEEDGPPPAIVILAESGRRKMPAPGIGERVLARIVQTPQSSPDQRYAARVMKRLARQPLVVLGVFRETPQGGLIEPVDRRQAQLTVAAADTGEAREGDLVEVEPLKRPRHGPPAARVVKRIGNLAGERAVSMIALHQHAIPHVFPPEVLAEAEAAAAELGKKGKAGREDWRDLPLITIDPADARDHDDAVHACPDPDPENPGGVIVTVAIADVAHFVRPGSALDREALNRANSVYFPDRVVPMLPERISNDVCSLKPGEDRFALAVRMVFDETGRKRGHRFHRIRMRSAASLSYTQAQAAIDGTPDEITAPLLDKVLRPLWSAYAVLVRERDAREPLDLDLPERKLVLKPDGTVERVIIPPRLDAHRLIEEFMVQANVAAAQTLEERHSLLVYRIHDAPSLAKLEALREFLSTIGIKLPRSGTFRPAHFNRILARVAETEHGALVNEVVLRSQAQAEYSPANIGHFGLNLRRYAHFTSPIRRYADLIVHRALIGALGLGRDGLPPGFEDHIEEIAERISIAERRAMAAERDTVDRLIAHFMVEHVGDGFTGRIAGVTRAGLFVRLPETGADGFVPIATLGEDYFFYEEAARALVGERSGETYRLGDTVDVRLVEAAPVAGALRFEMISRGRPGKAAARKGRARAGRSRRAKPVGRQVSTQRGKRR